jgi:hypothetical protein
MVSYLVVAHQTAASPELIAALREVAAEDREAAFVLLVPATPVRHLLTWVGGDEQEVARRRAEEATTTLQAADLNIVQSLVGDADPLRAIEQEHQRGGPYALTIISTLPEGMSRWLHRGLPDQVRTKLHAPVRHVSVRSAARAPASTLAAAPATLPAVTGDSLPLRELAAFRGRDLESADGVVGKVNEVLYDYVTGEPVWLGIAPRHALFRTLLVPAHTVSRDGDRLLTQLGRDRIYGQPHIDVGEGFDSLGDEENITSMSARASTASATRRTSAATTALCKSNEISACCAPDRRSPASSATSRASSGLMSRRDAGMEATAKTKTKAGENQDATGPAFLTLPLSLSLH